MQRGYDLPLSTRSHRERLPRELPETLTKIYGEPSEVGESVLQRNLGDGIL